MAKGKKTPSGVRGAGRERAGEGPAGLLGLGEVEHQAVLDAAESAEWGSPVAEDPEVISFADRGTGAYLDYEIADDAWNAYIEGEGGLTYEEIKLGGKPPTPSDILHRAEFEWEAEY